MTLMLKPGPAWSDVYARCLTTAPEAFHPDRVCNLWGGMLVDTEAELLAAMNASNGALVASLSYDDETTASRLATDLHAFKVGINRPRSRGDPDEFFSGMGAVWRGAFVGGNLLVRAVTQGRVDEQLPRNFPTYTLHPI